MRIRMLLPALLIGAGLWLPIQTPALAKTSYKYKKPKFKKYKAGRYQAKKIKKRKQVKVKHVQAQRLKRH